MSTTTDTKLPGDRQRSAMALPRTWRPARLGHDRRERLLTTAAVAIPAVLGLALCLYELTTRSLWLDEAATVAIASQHGAAFGSALAHDGGNMLGYYALLHVLIGAFGKGALVIRLPSALAAGATVAVVGLLGLRLFDRRVAFGAGMLAAVSLPLVYWGQNGRGYSLMIALIAGSFLALVAALQRDRAPAAWVAYVALTIAAAYAGLEAVLVIPAQLVLLLWYRSRLRPAAIAVGVIAVCCVPLAVLAASRGSGQLFWVPGVSATTAKQVSQALASSGLQPSFYTGTGEILRVLTAVVLAGAAWRTWRILRAPRQRSGARAPVLMLAWLAIPVALAAIESLAGQSIFQARYLLVSLPAVAVLLAWAALDPRIPRALGLALVVALVVLRALQLAPSYGVSPEDWRAATAYVTAHAGPRDCTAFYPLDNRMPFQYYLRAPATAPTSILPAVAWREVRAYVEDYATLSASALSRLPSRCGRVWLLTRNEGKVGGPPVSRANYARLASLTSALERDYPRTQTRTFGSAKTITLTLLAR